MPISLSKEYESLFDGMLGHVASWRPRRGERPQLTSCWTECGDDYAVGNGLLVLGRATNGFTDGFTLADIASVEFRRQLLQNARATAEGNPAPHRPLEWVDTLGDAEPTKVRKRPLGGTIGSRSAFWRVTRALLEELVPELPALGWYRHLAWGNLYKVAPNVTNQVSEGANPSSGLQQWQFNHCVRLLRQEIDEVRPRVVLVVAGESWYSPFTTGLNLEPIPRPGAKYVRHLAVERDGRMWIFTERPERRPQADFVKELRNAFRELQLQGG